MRIAIEGCCHGELDAIYAALAARAGPPADVLLVCGDFQAVRNMRDLQCVAMPDKYRKLGGFAKYYAGQARAPVLTLVIGGNHEAANYFWELYHGGWLAPNIYFLGHAGCVQVDGVRIAGLSGIFKPQDFGLGHYERLPYTHGSMRSAYHIREYNVRRLSLMTRPDIVLSHDWPQGISSYGDERGLLRRKPFFRADIESGALGSPPAMDLLHTLQPAWWFAAHLHVRFEACVRHGGPAGEVASAEGTNPDEIVIDEDDEDGVGEASAPAPRANPDEIALEDEEEGVAPPPAPPRETRFLALDKCLPRRQFLEVIDVPSRAREPGAPPALTFDPEWLAITRAFAPYMMLGRPQGAFPDEPAARAAVARERAWVEENVRELSVEACQAFAAVAPCAGEEGPAGEQPPYYPNPQTAAFCSMLGIENKVDRAYAGR